MLGTRGLTRLVILLSVFWYYRGTVLLNTIINKSSFPRGYVANGKYETDCKTVRDYAVDKAESMSSCEDETFWELRDAKGRTIERPVIITCDAGRRNWNTVMGPLRDPKPHGTLWLYFNAPTATTTGRHKRNAERILQPTIAPNKAHRITLKNYPVGHTFHPLGVEIWPSYAGNSSNLYVVNHAEKRTVIEQFILDPANPTEAVHVRTISSPYFLSPNGLALTSPDAFYVSNDHFFTRRLPIVGRFLPLLESVLGLPFGFVSHVTLIAPGSATGSGTAIAQHFFAKLFVPFANGVALSHGGEHLAIVSTSMAQIWFYGRDLATDRLTQLTNVVDVPFTPDNVHYTYSRATGAEEVIVGGHPNFPDVAAVAANKPGAAAASWVAIIIPKIGEETKPETGYDSQAPLSMSTKVPKDGARWTLGTLFQSDGVEEKGGFSSSTTGLRDPDSGAVYVTGLYAEGGLMVCKPGSKSTTDR